MANINLSNDSYVDYVASMYLKACGCVDVKFETKTVAVGNEQVPLIHVSGVQVSSGVVVNFDIWPRNNATADDLEAMPKSLDDIKFRIGYYASIDEKGEHQLRQGQPKWLSYRIGDKEFFLSGEKREFQG